MGMILVISSGKGGVGKSTVAVGLAAAFSRNDRSVLLVDADEGLRCLDGMLGTADGVLLDVSDAAADPDRLPEAVVPVASVPGLSLLAAPLTFGTIDPEPYGKMIARAAERYDVVIVDCPAGIDERYYRNLPRESRVLVVTNSDAAAIHGAVRAGMMARGLGFTDLHLILNKFSAGRVGSLHANADAILDETGIALIGIVPNDDEIVRAAAHQRPSVRGRGAMAFGRIAARLAGETVLLPSVGRI